MKKVYCEECKFLRKLDTTTIGKDKYLCFHPSNLTINKKENRSWLSRKYNISLKCKETPNMLNYNNKCEKFEAITIKEEL